MVLMIGLLLSSFATVCYSFHFSDSILSEGFELDMISGISGMYESSMHLYSLESSISGDWTSWDHIMSEFHLSQDGFSVPRDFSLDFSHEFSIPHMFSMPQDFSQSQDFSIVLMSADTAFSELGISSDFRFSNDMEVSISFSETGDEPTAVPTPWPFLPPSAYPSVMPSSSPTAPPSLAPTAPPSLAPITSLPTLAPTVKVTSSPTAVGESNRPTVVPTRSPTFSPTLSPTLAPTQSLLTRWNLAIADYLGSTPNIGLRGSLYVEIYDGARNQNVRGGCSSLSTFVTDDLYAKLIALTPVRLIFASTGSPSQSISAAAAVCAGSRLTSDSLDDVIAALTKPATTGVETLVTTTCNGRSWVAGTCATGQPVLCVGCTNPCANKTRHFSVSCNSASGQNQMNLLKVDFDPVSVPVDIIDTNVTAQGTTSLKVDIAVTAVEGSLVCAAYLASSAFVPNSVGRIAVGRQVISITSRQMEYVIPGLRAASIYDVYCGTVSVLGAPMLPAAMQRTKVTESTGCCRTVKVTLATTSFRNDRDTPNAIAVDVGSYLPSDLYVAISASYRAGASGPYTPVQYTFMPAGQQFQLSSSSPRFQFAYNRSTVGYYQVTTSLAGASANKYTVEYPTGSNFRVTLSTVQPIPPVMSSAQFASDGASVRVTFNSPTNRGGVSNLLPNCHNFFAFAGLSSTSRCVWLDDFTVDIFASGNGGPVVGDSLVVKPNKIKAACTISTGCSSWNYTSTHAVMISSASNPLTPNVAISGPSEVGACDSVSIDIGRSSGGGGRDWASIIFKVESSAQNRSDVEAYLNAVPFKTRQITIPNRLLNVRKAYAISVVMCNFLGQCGQDSLPVIVSSSTNVPVVSIKSDKKFTVKRFNRLSLVGDAYTSECSGTISRSKLSFVWTIYENGVLLTDTAFQSVSKDPREFLLEKYTLSVGSIYTITLTVTHSDSKKYSSASVEVAVVQGAIIAVVDKAAAFGLRVTETITISGAKSFDQDYTNVIGSAAGLSFSLGCVQISPTYSSNCGLTVVDNGGGAYSVSVPGSATSFEASVHQLTLFVQHTSSERSAQSKIEMTILPSTSAKVALSTSGSNTINPSNKVAIRATIQYASEGNAEWTVDDPTLLLASASSSLVQRSLPSPPAGTSFNVETSLIIPKDTLQEMSTYTFSLKVSLKSGLITTSSIVITTNAPPSMGQFEVSPHIGEEYSTIFEFLASQFEDPDLPLSYEFAISSGNKFSVFRERQPVTYATSFLPKGPSSQDFAFETRVQVYDVLDGKTLAYGEVVVLQSSTPLNATQIIDDISSSLADGSTSDITTAASIVSGIVNSAECGSAPHCHSLNRENCSKVDNTCGKCLEGFTGRGRYANTMCVAESTFSRRLSATSSSCTSNAHCNADMFEVCLTGTCSPEPLACPSSCSGHGQCKFHNKYEVNGYYLSECTVLSTNCVAKCLCDAGFSGSGCQYTLQEFEDAQDLRHLVVQAYKALVATQTPSRDVVVAWIDGLVEIASFPEDLSLSSKLLMVEIARDIIDIATSLGLSYEDISELKIVLDLTLDAINSDGRRRLDTSSDLISLFEAYASYLLDDMLPDQHAITIVTDLYRITANTYDGLDGVTLSLPQMGTEIVAGAPTQEIQLAEDDNGTYKILLFELLVLIHASGANKLLQSVPLSMMFDRSLCEGATGDIDACSFIVILQNFEFGQLASAEEMEHITTCETGIVHDYTYSCPSGRDITASCDGEMVGKIYSECPIRYPASNCSSFGMFNAVCETVSFDSTSTVCKCSLPGTTDSLHVELGSTATSYVVEGSATFVGDEPDHHQKGGSFPENASKSYAVVITTLVTLGVTLAWAVGVFFARTSDRDGAKTAPAFQDLQQLDSSLPNIYQRKGLVRAWNEIACHHRWFSLVFGKNPLMGKDYQLLSLWTNVLIFFFLESIVYNLSDRHERDCKKFMTRTDCESDESFLGLSEAKCRWDGSSKYCTFNEPDSSVLRVVFCAVFVAILTVPCSILVEYLIARVLCATTLGNEGVGPSAGDVFVGAPPSGAATAPTAGKSLDVECEDMDARIRACSASLHGGEKNDFDASWNMGDGVKKSQLAAVREETRQELQHLTRSGLTPAERRSRVMFLFFRDFLMGNPLSIVVAKDRRDHPPKVSASAAVKMLVWGFLVCANVGMFAYVILFGSKQSTERQRAWVYSYFAYLLMDMFLFNVAFVLWTHIFVPLCASNAVRIVETSVLGTIIEGQARSGRGQVPSDRFNAAQFLFTSHRVASALNSFEEQNPTSHFSTIWPKTVFEAKGVLPVGSLTADGCRGAIGAAISSIPNAAHDVLFGVCFTAFFGFIVIAHIPLYRADAVMGFVPLIVFMGCTVAFCSLIAMQSSHHGMGVSPGVSSAQVQPVSNQSGMSLRTPEPAQQMAITPQPPSELAI